MGSWNFLFAAVFAFMALSLLAVAANISADVQTAQFLVSSDFGQLADQAWDSWSRSIFDLFGFLF